MSTVEHRLQLIRHVALDLDGTVYRGATVFPFTLPFLATLQELGIAYSFLTNNSSRSTAEYVRHLNALGIPANLDQLFTSTGSTVAFLREEYPKVQRLFVLGTAGLSEELSQAGFAVTADDAQDVPDAVVVGFDTGLEYARLCRAAYWIQQNRIFIATHPDRICPSDQPTLLVDCGAICAALTEATGRRPDAVLGKPDPRMVQGILERHRLAPRELAVVGDRLYTDMELGRRSGALSVLVLTGETRPDHLDYIDMDPSPDVVVADLEEFGQRLRNSAATPK